MDTIESKVLVLIESVANLSRITANHDLLLTKLVDDHEIRIRELEKCETMLRNYHDLEVRVQSLETWKWYALGAVAAGIAFVELLFRFKIF